MNQASHYVDMLDWLIGPVESVQAYTATLARNIEVEDTGVARAPLARGTLGSLNVTMLTYPEESRGLDHRPGREGHGPGGRDGGEQDRALGFRGAAIRWTRKWSGRATRPPRCTAWPSALLPQRDPDPARRGRGPDTDGREGLHSLEILIATYLSARDGRRVALPLE